jgi:hypoxanthine phosphoribosyltransferase
VSDTDILIARDELAAIVARLGADISRDHPDGVVLIAVLKGALVFLADLVRQVTVPVEIDFLALTRYAPDSGRVRLLKDIDVDVTDRAVILVEDLVDTGLTLAFLSRQLRERGAQQVEVCALLDRTPRRMIPLALRYVGKAVGEEYLLGYGLHHRDRYRNLGAVHVGDRAELDRDPDAYVASWYGKPPGTVR